MNDDKAPIEVGSEEYWYRFMSACIRDKVIYPDFEGRRSPDVDKYRAAWERIGREGLHVERG